jgi:hypothetical protein
VYFFGFFLVTPGMDAPRPRIRSNGYGATAGALVADIVGRVCEAEIRGNANAQAVLGRELKRASTSGMAHERGSSARFLGGM